ncbi:MAG: PqqD family protein [Actinobacteria bacterium]|nr:PqqD family protein [Actinomycetota bacterium]
MAKSTSSSPSEISSLPVRAGHLVERVVDGELVLYDPRNQYVHALNPTAAFVWGACDGEHDTAAIVAELAQLYPESLDAIESDVPEILMQFHGSGLLQA